MTVNKEQIQHLAKLARLAITGEEEADLSTRLSVVVDYVERLNQVDVASVIPMTHAVPLSLRLRPDEPEKVLGREALATSAGYENGLVKVPKIIE